MTEGTVIEVSFDSIGVSDSPAPVEYRVITTRQWQGAKTHATSFRSNRNSPGLTLEQLRECGAAARKAKANLGQD